MAFSPVSVNSGDTSTETDFDQLQANVTAVRTQHAGTSAPSNLTEGVRWLDTNISSQYIMKYYDGSDWINLWMIDPLTHTASYFTFVSDDSVQAVNLASGAIQYWHINSGSINSYHLLPNGVGATEMNSAAITAAKIQDGSVPDSALAFSIGKAWVEFGTAGASGSASSATITMTQYTMMFDFRGSAYKRIQTHAVSSGNQDRDSPAMAISGDSGAYDIDWRYFSS